ncbi:MAG: 4-hydroxyphenylacetate 3-hydroxylase family protein [Candidatus Bathyarchaeota archaeon]
MVLKTSQEYVESLRRLKLNVYMFGEKIINFVEHPIIKPSINSVAKTYEVAEKPEYASIATANSHLTGEKINRFTHIHQNVEDLIKKLRLLRVLGQLTGTCFQRCPGWDAINALYSVTYEIDKKHGTRYHENLKEYVKYLQQEDLAACAAMTDPKGDRSLRPSTLPDKDLYLHVVEELKDGVVVRGAKAHQTGALNSHEKIVMPTLAMNDDEKAYAISFAIPSDADGIIYIYGRQSCDLRKMEKNAEIDLGNASFGGQEALIVFNDVFIPRERIFMFGENEFSRSLVERFAGFHRHSYGGCKVGCGDVLIGATALIAEYNGIADASHVRDKIAEMIHLNETLWACGLAASVEGKKTDSGAYLIDLMLANVCKLNVTRNPYEIARLAQDIAGGLMVTLPSEKDFKHPEIGKYLNKYFKGKIDIPTEHRTRILRLIENMTLGFGAVGYLVESLHGAGSPQTQKVMIRRLTDLEYKKKIAKEIAGIR